uniref:Integrase catalytic domain-containing protein n=1 Tax=Caldilinea aerophila TaxID=133453 RepID=A0A7C1JGR0_9CHLR
MDSLFRTEHDLQQAVAQAIHLYNTERPHLALNDMTPQAVY